MTNKDDKDHSAELIHQTIPDIAGTEPRPSRRIAAPSGLAMMAALAASAPVMRSEYELRAPVPSPFGAVGWPSTRATGRCRSKTGNRKRTNRERMQKASRKRNR